MKAPIERHRPGPAAKAAARLGGRIPVLDTRRLQLRGPRIYDFAAFAAIYESDRARFMGGPFSREQAWAEFTNYTALWLLHGHGLWTIDAAVQPSAGFVVLGYEYTDPECELGVFLTAEAEGRGIAEEALRAVRAHAFAEFGMESVVSYVDPANSRCIAMMQRLGAARDPEAEAALAEAGTFVFRHRPEAA